MVVRHLENEQFVKEITVNRQRPFLTAHCCLRRSEVRVKCDARDEEVGPALLEISYL
jgi:hypothetical protein